MLTKACWLLLLVFYPFLLAAFCFDEAAREEGVNANVLRSIARIESNNNPSAIGHNRNGSKDLGVMQINSSWIKIMGLNREELTRNPCYNVRIAARILKQCIDIHGYTWKAVGCYHAVDPNLRAQYSWKIFGELDRINRSEKKLSSPETNKPSLYFAVRDSNKEDP